MKQSARMCSSRETIDIWVGNGLFSKKKEGTDAAQVGIDGMTGETSRLGRGEWMTLEAPLSPEVEDEGPDLQVGDRSYIGAGSVAGEEIIQVADARIDDGDGLPAMAHGSGMEGIYTQQGL